MSKYTGCKCPVCQQPFNDGDDIVVCPDCGAPYHRACWDKTKRCVYADRHGTAFSWEPENKPKPESETLVCPRCGAANPADAQFCNQCALPFAAASRQAAAGAARQPHEPDPSRNESDNGPAQFRSGPYIYERRLGPEDTIDGIKAKEWAVCIGRSVPFYLLQFQRMAETGRRSSISFSAMFFGPLYFFYRKMWKWGVIFSALFLVYTLPGIAYLLALTGSPYVTALPIGLLERLMNVSVFLEWGCLIFRGLFALFLYKNTVRQKILSLQEEFPNEEDRMHVMAAEGGTSLKGVILALLLYFIMILSVVFLAGPDLYALLGTLYV